MHRFQTAAIASFCLGAAACSLQSAALRLERDPLRSELQNIDRTAAVLASKKPHANDTELSTSYGFLNQVLAAADGVEAPIPGVAGAAIRLDHTEVKHGASLTVALHPSTPYTDWSTEPRGPHLSESRPNPIAPPPFDPQGGEAWEQPPFEGGEAWEQPPSEGGAGSAAPSTEATLGSPAGDVSPAELRGTWRLNVEESVRRMETSPGAAGESRKRLHDLVRGLAAGQEMVIGEAKLSLSSGSRTQTITPDDIRTEGDTVIYAYSHGGADGELELTLRNDGMLDMYNPENDDVNWMVWQRAKHWELPDPLPEPPPPQPITDEEKQAKSLETIARVGNAMLSLLIDRMDGGFTLEVSQLPESWSYETEDRESEPLRRVPHADVVELLVPDYVTEVPNANPWGHSYQFAINENLMGPNVMSIRCPGRDDRFDTDAYTLGTFPEKEFDRDIVWADGLWIRRPEH